MSLSDEIGGRNLGLSIILFSLTVIGLWVLSEVFWTIFLATVFAYVLYPLKQELGRKGLSDRQSAAAVTSSAFILLFAFIAPFLLVLFRRRQILIDFISSLPETVSFEVFNYSFAYTTMQLEDLAKNWVANAAVKLAESLPSLSLKALLFIFLLHAMLKHSKTIEEKILELLPGSAEEILFRYHERIKKTLVGIFAVQTITAVMTFIIALPVFYFLGYKAFISLALIAAVLQFIPILGPIMLIAVLVLLEIATGTPIKAFTILIFGIFIIGALPDAYLRPKLAGKTTGLPASLYFVGFVGGALTLGAIGALAGPLTIAIIIETTELLTE